MVTQKSLQGNCFIGWKGLPFSAFYQAFEDLDSWSFSSDLIKKSKKLVYLHFVIPEGVTSIADGAFEDCLYLQSIRLPKSLRHIGKRAFKGCQNLSSIELPRGLKSIGEGAFEDCWHLRELILPKRVQRIEAYTFKNCIALKWFYVTNRISFIGNEAFCWCKKLKRLYLPNSVRTIDGNPFVDWEGKIYNFSNAFVYEDEVLYNADKTTIIAYRAKGESFEIPDGVTTIGSYAFYGCWMLKNLTIPTTVKEIGDKAFEGCDSLTCL